MENEKRTLKKKHDKNKQNKQRTYSNPQALSS